MRLPRAYRSLPRLSSHPEPSHPLNGSNTHHTRFKAGYGEVGALVADGLTDRVSFLLTPLLYQTDLISALSDCLVLSWASSLDAFRSYPLARGCPAMLFTTGRLEAPSPRSSRTQGLLLSGNQTLPEDTTVLSRDVLNPAHVSL